MMSKNTEVTVMPKMKVNDIDKKIIEILIEDARISYTDLAKEVGLSRVAVQARINTLLKDGVIERFTAVINPVKVGIHVSTFFNIDVEPKQLNEVAEKLALHPVVTNLYHMTGPSTLHMHAVFTSMTEMERFLLETVYPTTGITSVASEVLIKRYKSRTGMKL